MAWLGPAGLPCVEVWYGWVEVWYGWALGQARASPTASTPRPWGLLNLKGGGDGGCESHPSR